MYKKALIVISFFILGWGFNYLRSPKIEKPIQHKENIIEKFVEKEIKKETIQDARNSITTPELKEMLTTLSSDEYEGRRPGTEGWNKTRDFIEKEFKSYGLETQLQKFNVREISTENIIGIFPGHELKDEYVVVGAHADHLGKRGNNIFHGADDNGSGTVGLLEVAEALGKVKDSLKRSVVFISFSSEEMGLLGSKYYCSNPIYPTHKTVAMINLDMIGYLNNNSLSCIGAGRNQKLADFIQKIDDNYSFSTKITSNIGGGSDHASFNAVAVPTVFIHTGLHRNYHKPTDTVEKIDFAGMTAISKFVLDLTYEISQNF